MKKLFFLALAGILMLSGCSTGTTTEESPAPTGETASIDEQAAEPLTVYLNDFDAIIPDLFKEKTGYDVEVVVGNGAEIMSRIEAEKSNPQWDVVWMDWMYDIYNLDLDGQLTTNVDVANAANLTDEFSALVPDDKCFYPTGAHAAGVIVYRNDIWSEEDAPKSYEDLTDPKYAGQIAMADPGVAAPAYPLAAYFFDEMSMDGAKEYFTTLFENGLDFDIGFPQLFHQVIFPDGVPSVAFAHNHLKQKVTNRFQCCIGNHQVDFSTAVFHVYAQVGDDDSVGKPSYGCKTRIGFQTVIRKVDGSYRVKRC